MSQYSHLTADLSNENSSITKIVRLVGHDRTVLDVGCAHGYLGEVLRARGCRVVGVERDPEDAARARAHCEQVVVRDVEEPDWIEELNRRRFDVIVFADVLEHLRDPARVLRETLELLAPDTGFIVASIPNVAHVSVRLELLLGSFRRETLGILDATHLHFFTRDSLEEFLASCGIAAESWDCTTNEIADHVVADYLQRAGLPYTRELRERFAQPDAQAYQFVIKARPAKGVAPSLPAPLEKPIQVIENLVREFERTRVELARTQTELSRTQTELSGELSRTRAELARSDTELARTQTELARTQTELARTQTELSGELSRTRAELARSDTQLARMRMSPVEVERPRDGGLRVLQVVHQFVPRHTGGTEIYCSDLSFALARRGHAVRVLSGAPFRDDVGTRVHWEGDAAVAVELLPATRTYRRLGSVGRFFDRFDNPAARVAIREALDRMRPDVVHVQHLLHLSAELIPECHTRHIPVVVTLNDYWFLCHRIKLVRRDGALCEGPARGWNCCQCLNTSRLVRSHLNPAAVGANLYRYAYLVRRLEKADRILAPSRFVREVYGRNGVDAARIVVCDYGTASPPPELAARLRARRRHEPVRFGFLGALIRDKGVHVLIDAFNRLPAGCAELHIFGPAADPAYNEDLRRRAQHPGIRWRGPVPHPERWAALAEVDVVVVPSIWYENSPLAIHEAHMAGVPVIGSATGGIPEHVRDSVDGRTFPAGDVDALAACLRGVVEDPESLARWERATIAPKTMEAHVLEIESIYREVVTAPPARAAS